MYEQPFGSFTHPRSGRPCSRGNAGSGRLEDHRAATRRDGTHGVVNEDTSLAMRLTPVNDDTSAAAVPVTASGNRLGNDRVTTSIDKCQYASARRQCVETFVQATLDFGTHATA